MSLTTITSFPSPSATNMKIWGSAASTYLDTINPKTTDTGQTDWTTYNTPASSGTYTANEVRRFNDSLQSAAPIFYKIFYGSTGGGTIPAFQLIVGTSTDGVGNIGGNKIQAIAPAASGGSTTFTARTLISGDTNRVAFAFFAEGDAVAQGSRCGVHLGLERTKDSLGNDTTEGVLITAISPSSDTGLVRKVNQFLPFMGGVPNPDILGTIGAVNGNGTDGADVITCPNFAFRGSGFMNPGLNIEIYMNGSVNPGTVAPIERYGISHNYYFIGNNTSFTGLLRGNEAWIPNSTLAIRWE